MPWMPGASRVQTFSGNRHKRAITKIVLHTTEGSGWPGYNGGGNAPHFTVHRDGTIRQHINTDQSAKALVNRSGGVETNNGGCIQIEFIGSCDRAWARKHGIFFTENATDKDLAGLAKVLAWISKTHGVPLTATGLRWPTTNAAYASAPQRFSFAQWNAYKGVCGHTHVPENDHWDPGAFPVARLLRLAGGASIPAGGTSVPVSKPADPAKPWTTSPRVNAMSAAEVRAIQTELVDAGYDLGSYGVDGSYGDSTGTAVKALQSDLDLTADGVWGPTTQEALMSLKSDVAAIRKRTDQYLDHNVSDVVSKLRADLPDRKQLDQVHDYIVRRAYTDMRTSVAVQRVTEAIVQAAASTQSIDPDQIRAAVAAGVDEALGSLEVTVSKQS